jgi:hypothetical protein
LPGLRDLRPLNCDANIQTLQALLALVGFHQPVIRQGDLQVHARHLILQEMKNRLRVILRGLLVLLLFPFLLVFLLIGAWRLGCSRNYEEQ